MNPETQQLAIAKIVGYKPDPETGLWYVLGHDIIAGFNQEKQRIEPIPDFLNILDAMHEAEKTIIFEPKPYDAMIHRSDSQQEIEHKKRCDLWMRYTQQLVEIVARDLGGWEDHFLNALSLCICATATQRAEAFLRTLNLWTP